MLNMRTLLPQPSRAAFATNIITAPWTYDTAHTADANTILLYHAEDNAANTNVTDSSGNGYTGTSSANTNTWSGAGKFNLALDIDGETTTSNTITLNSVAYEVLIRAALQAAITFECWIKWNANADWSAAVAADSNIVTIEDANLAGNNMFWARYERANNSIDFVFKANGTTNERKTAPAAAPVDTTNWAHICMTKSTAADEFKAYINMVQVGATSTGLGVFQNNDLITRIGNLRPGAVNQAWAGFIDELAISNKIRY